MFDFGNSGQGGAGKERLPPIDHPLGINFFLSPTFLCIENPRWRPFHEEVLSVRSP